MAGTKRSVEEDATGSKLRRLSGAEEACEATALFVLPGSGKAAWQNSVQWLLWRPGLSDGGREGEEEEEKSVQLASGCQSERLLDTLIADLVRHTESYLLFEI